MFERFKSGVRRRIRAWARRRVGHDPDPLTLQQRRIYILPTRQGLIFGLLLFAMLLGSMNYSASLAFALTFMLAGLGFVAMHHCHRNLLDLQVRMGRVEPVFAGGDAHFPVIVENRTSAPRLDIQLEFDDEIHDIADVPARGSATLQFMVPAPRRGRLRPDCFGFMTSYPFGLFRAWTWVYMDLSCIVYPKPAGRRLTPPPVPTRDRGIKDLSSGDDDFAGLRGYRLGDAPRHIHWKAFAREQGLQVKVFTGSGFTTQWFDFDSLPGNMRVEARLSQLCRWVLDAAEDGRPFGLRLPGRTIPPASGEGHRRMCLTALALFGEDDRTGGEVEDARRAA